MKLASYQINNKDSFGIVTDEGIIDLSSRVEGGITDLKSLIDHGLQGLEQIALEVKPDYALEEVSFLPVIPNPGIILCVGLNTQSHFDEVGEALGIFNDKPEQPWLFTRSARAQVGHGQTLEKPNGSPLYDYEGEIAVIIGKKGRFVTEDDALDYVAGYSCFNDGSLRDFQMHSPLFTSGKNFPRSGGFGPWLVTTDEISSPESLHLTTRVNGEVVQEMPYSDLLFTFPQLISYISQFTELLPGDVIVTGTAAGVGVLRQPPLMLQHGDICEVEVSGVGTLVNPVADAQGENRAPVTRANVDEVLHSVFKIKPRQQQI